MLPTDTSIEFTIASNDVIHSFYVPEFLFKRDVFPMPEKNDTDNVFVIDRIEPRAQPSRGHPVRGRGARLVVEQPAQAREVTKAFDGGARERDAEPQRGALVRPRESLEIEGLEQSPGGPAFVAAVLELRETKPRRRGAVATRVVRENPAQPPPPFFGTVRREGELGELFEGVVRERTPRVRPHELLERGRSPARIGRELSHRGVVGRALLPRHLLRREAGAARRYETERDRQRDPTPRPGANPVPHTPLAPVFHRTRGVYPGSPNRAEMGVTPPNPVAEMLDAPKAPSPSLRLRRSLGSCP